MRVSIPSMSMAMVLVTLFSFDLEMDDELSARAHGKALSWKTKKVTSST